jgi:hypothetical protein
MEAYWNIEQVLSMDWEEIVDPSTINHVPGVYMLRDGFTGRIDYVGNSTYIGFRLRTNRHPVYIPNLHKVFILRIESEHDRHYIENRCIELLKPRHNRRRGFMPKEDIKQMADEEHKRIFG